MRVASEKSNESDSVTTEVELRGVDTAIRRAGGMLMNSSVSQGDWSIKSWRRPSFLCGVGLNATAKCGSSVWIAHVYHTTRAHLGQLRSLMGKLRRMISVRPGKSLDFIKMERLGGPGGPTRWLSDPSSGPVTLPILPLSRSSVRSRFRFLLQLIPYLPTTIRLLRAESFR